MESPMSLISCTLNNDSSHQYYCVGTAFVRPEEAEPKSGRLILFLLEDGKSYALIIVNRILGSNLLKTYVYKNVFRT